MKMKIKIWGSEFFKTKRYFEIAINLNLLLVLVNIFIFIFLCVQIFYIVLKYKNFKFYEFDLFNNYEN